jgi:hypothetical protein
VASDLDGLSDAFDTHHDGVFNAADAQFGQFKVWQDANQNGVSDAGEVRSLADWGIASINLVSDGVVRTPAAGVTEAGQTTATTADGSSVLVADAAFAYSSLSYSLSNANEPGAAVGLNLLGSGMDLDLSSFVAQLGTINAVDLSGTGANQLKIGLDDVLSGGMADGLRVTGDADDSVLLDANDWLAAGSVTQDDGKTYAVFNGANGGLQQVLIDQQVTLLMA